MTFCIGRRNFITLLGAAAWPAGDAGDRVSQRGIARWLPAHGDRIPSGLARIWLCRGPERGNQIPLGGGPVFPVQRLHACVNALTS
jgi:hypothetical protein